MVTQICVLPLCQQNEIIMTTQESKIYLQTPQGVLFTEKVAHYLILGLTMDESVLKATNYINDLLTDSRFKDLITKKVIK